MSLCRKSEQKLLLAATSVAQENEKQASVCISAANHLSAALQEQQPQVGDNWTPHVPLAQKGVLHRRTFRKYKSRGDCSVMVIRRQQLA